MYIYSKKKEKYKKEKRKGPGRVWGVECVFWVARFERAGFLRGGLILSEGVNINLGIFDREIRA
jgi:hypothetical protein